MTTPPVPVRRQRPVTSVLVLLACISAASCGDSLYDPGASHATETIVRTDQDPLAGGSAGITVPTTGKSDDGGEFRGTITITGAAFDPEIGPVLLGRIHGSLLPRTTEEEGDPSEDVSLGFGSIEFDYDDHVATDKDCIHLEIRPGSVFDSETKRTVDIEAARIMSHRLPGPANLFADLICAVDEAIEAGWSMEEQGPQQ